MAGKLNNAQIAKMILEGMVDSAAEEEDLIHLLVENKVSRDVQHKSRDKITLGERVADKVARTAGSWAFIFSFCGFLAIWIISNALILTKPFDPFPFILLNLFLSCVAALQAPVIMMSQNRQEEKDRIRAENDYRVNLKSEVIIEDLHNKLDRMIANQEAILAALHLKTSPGEKAVFVAAAQEKEN